MAVRRAPHHVLGVDARATRAQVDRQFRRRAARQKRLLAHTPGALDRLVELNEAYAALTRRSRPAANPYLVVGVAAAILALGYLAEIPLRLFVSAPLILGAAAFFLLVDVGVRKLKEGRVSAPTADAVVADAERLLGGPLDDERLPTVTNRLAEGPYLREPLVVGDRDDPAGFIDAGTPLPANETFVLTATERDGRALRVSISAGSGLLPGVRLLSPRSFRGGDIIELRLSVDTSGATTLEAFDTYTEEVLRIELEGDLVASVEVGTYRG